MSVPPKNLERLGLALRAHRDSSDILQEDAAQKVGVTQAYLSQLENGARVPSLDVLASLARCYETKIWCFLKDAGI